MYCLYLCAIGLLFIVPCGAVALEVAAPELADKESNLLPPTLPNKSGYVPGELRLSFRRSFDRHATAFNQNANENTIRASASSFHEELRALLKKSEKYNLEDIATDDLAAIASAHEYLMEWREVVEVSKAAVARADCTAEMYVPLIRSQINVGDTDAALGTVRDHGRKFSTNRMVYGFMPIIAEKQLSVGGADAARRTLQELVVSVLGDGDQLDVGGLRAAATAVCRIFELCSLPGNEVDVVSWADKISTQTKRLKKFALRAPNDESELGVESRLIESAISDLYCCSIQRNRSAYLKGVADRFDSLLKACERCNWENRDLRCELVSACERTAAVGVCDENLLGKVEGIYDTLLDYHEKAKGRPEGNQERPSGPECPPARIAKSIVDLEIAVALSQMVGKSVPLPQQAADKTVDRSGDEENGLAACLVVSRIPEDFLVSAVLQSFHARPEVSHLRIVVCSSDDGGAAGDVEALAVRMKKIHRNASIDIVGEVADWPIEDLALPREHLSCLLFIDDANAIVSAEPVVHALRKSVPFLCAQCIR
jgi:hypothetical protein